MTWLIFCSVSACFSLNFVIFNIYRDKCTRIIRTEVRLLWQAEGKQRGYQEHPSYFLCFWFVLPSPFICLFSHSFIHQLLFFFPSVSLSFSSSRCPKGLGWKGDSLGEKGGFLPLSLSLSFTFFLESLFPRFIPSGPLSSLVECPTLWCVWGIGRRGRRGLRFEGVEIHERVHVWVERVDEGEEKVTK